MTDSKRLSLSIILASATLTIMAGSIIAPVLNLMRDGLGVAPAYVGLIITTHGLFMALFSPLMGSIIDRKGVRQPYIAALILYGLAGGSGLLIDSFGLFLVSRAFLGIGLAGVFAGINVLILNMYDGIERDRVMGWRGSAQSFGGVIWPLIGGALGAASWRLPFAVYMIAIPIGLLALAAVPEPIIQQRVKPDPRNEASVWTIFRNTPVLYMIYGLIFCANLLLYSIVVFLPQRLEGFGIHNTFHIGLFITAMTAAAGLTALTYGTIRSRFNYRVIVTLAVVLWILAFITIAWAPHSGIIATAVALFGVSQGLIMPTVMVWIGAVVPASFRGRFSSYLGTFGFVGQFLSPILFAPVFVSFSFKGIFLTGAGIGAGWFVLLLTIGSRIGPSQTRGKKA
jgi:MFS transporter, ACDE family, multidrug resistance protein